MHQSTFCGVDINSITNLNRLILQLSRDKNSVPGLIWTTQYVGHADTINKATKNNQLVWDEYIDGENRMSKINLKNDQGKSLIIIFTDKIVDVQEEGSKTFNFKKCCYYEIHFGISKDFPSFFHSQFERIKIAANSIFPGVSFNISLEFDRLFLILDRPLITSTDEEQPLRNCIDVAINEAEKIIQEFKKDHFLGTPFNKWEMYVYLNSDSSAQSYFAKLNVESLKKSLINPQDYTLEVEQKGNVIRFVIYQHYENSKLDCVRTFQDLYDSFFKNETAKIFDKMNTIATIELTGKF